METLKTLHFSYKQLFQTYKNILLLNIELLHTTIFAALLAMFLLIVLLLINYFLILVMLQFVPCGKPGKKSVSFFHPYCNAGGGGERVLWCSIQAIQSRYPDADCYVYTGDGNATPHEIMENVYQRFNIRLEKHPTFIYLKLRSIVEAKYYPVFTLLMQSLGSFILGVEALSKFRPNVYVDTMGYAFTYPLFRFLGGSVVASYTHYPTISSDMLERVSARIEAHNNRPYISQQFVLSTLKIWYYHLFAFFYGLVGSCAHVVMVNSSWTKGHISAIWKFGADVHTVFPPCDTTNFSSLALIGDAGKDIKTIVSIGQFRPEKDYPLQLRSFKRLLQITDPTTAAKLRLVLIGGVRNADDEKRVESLKSLAEDLDIAKKIEWKINASFVELLQEVQKGTIGIHAMWNEHFGIGLVESMAGGLIVVAHDSGGPKMDIVTPFNGQRTGFLASTKESYAEKMKEILNLSSEEKINIKEAARASVTRFSEENFRQNFLHSMQALLNTNRRE